ncbi:ATP-binding protein [Uliginosibacterium sp. H1]|uniref:ATP-binding protein n=1 Tax=Uliginosibacterium sp. H1 TaxID=3114757 RepID=UPI002E1981EF|nr:ATP-binding protein [Uliginosibacterium sp. H1]
MTTLPQRQWTWLLAIWVGLALFIAAAGLFVGRLLEEQALAPIRTFQLQRVARLAEGLQTNLRKPVEDIRSLAGTRAVQAVIPHFSPAALDQLADQFMLLANGNSRIDQLRLLDARGMECLRINHRHGISERVATQDLQDKAGRYYFERSRTLAPGQIFVSRIDLNVENNRIEQPIQPTMRVATPLHGPDGSLAAVLVLNVAITELSTSFRRETTPENPVLFADHEGYWLKAPRPELEWGFQLERPDARIDRYELALADVVNQPERQQLRSRSGLWSLDRTDLPDLPGVALPGERGPQEFNGLLIATFVPEAVLQEATRRGHALTWVLALAVWLLLAVGSTVLMMAFEARKQQAHAAEQARVRLRLALLGGKLSMWIYDFDKPGLYLNASWEQITGHSQGPRDLDGWLALMHANDCTTIRNALEAMGSGRQTTLDTVLRLRHRDGNWLTLACYGGVVEYDAQGRPRQAAGVLRDQSALAYSERRLQMALRGGELCWWDWHLPSDRIVLDERFSQITGVEYRPDIALSANAILGTLVHPDDLADVQESLQAHCSGKTGFYATETRLRRATGGWAWVSSRGEVVERGEDGTAVRIVGTFHDITPRKELQLALIAERASLEQKVEERTRNLDLARAEAERANMAKNTFLTNISHEMRTPMHGIIGFADMGAKHAGQAPPDLLVTYFDSIRQSASRLLSLINDLLDISKLDSGMMSFHPEPIDPRYLVESHTAELEALARQKNLRFRVELAPDLPQIVADPVRIGQVLRNLLANAIRYSPEAGVIAITVDRAGRALRFVVSDEGCGIPPDELESIFEKFVQSTRTQSGAGGSGLGLSICREIVAHHGGHIQAYNNPERGSSFEFVLPLDKEAA